jgi:hypothetical protein
MRRAVAGAVLVVGAAVAVWLLWPRTPRSDEELIRETIGRMCGSASQKDVGGILEHVSDGYRGEGGSKDELKGYLLGYLLRSDIVSVLPGRVEVEVRGSTARARLAVVLARVPLKTAAEASPGSLAGSHYIETELAKEADGRWRVQTASRRDAAPLDWLK